MRTHSRIQTRPHATLQQRQQQQLGLPMVPVLAVPASVPAAEVTPPQMWRNRGAGNRLEPLPAPREQPDRAAKAKKPRGG